MMILFFVSLVFAQENKPLRPLTKEELVLSMRSEGMTDPACHAWLKGYLSPVQEALKSPYDFARSFRSYLYPDEKIRLFLAELVMQASHIPAQYIPLFDISREEDRARLVRIGIQNDVAHTLLYLDQFNITDPKLMAVIMDEFFSFVDAQQTTEKKAHFFPTALTFLRQNSRSHSLLSLEHQQRLQHYNDEILAWRYSFVDP